MALHLLELRLENLRNLECAEVVLGPGLNLFIGANGAGKTSILEGVYLLSHGRSFRTAQSDVLIRRGATALTAFARVESKSGIARLGMQRQSGRWRATVNGESAKVLVEAVRCCAVVCFEPGSHALISGPSDERRRFVDWGVFHVEREHARRIGRFQRALKQRNALLKQGGSDNELDSWDQEFAEAAESVAEARERYFLAWSPLAIKFLNLYLHELGAASMLYHQGWDNSEALLPILLATRQRDRARGTTGRGPHRGDWETQFELAPNRAHLSRGQEKLCAIACLLAQAELFSHNRGEWPIIALDDLPSELDEAHQLLVMETLLARSAQILVTATEPVALTHLGAEARRFHVEQGRVQALL